MRRPVALRPSLSAGVLIALAIPALGMTTTQSGPDDLPQDLPIMKTYDRYTAAFPDKVNVNEVVVEADDVRGGEVAGAIDSWSTTRPRRTRSSARPRSPTATTARSP